MELALQIVVLVLTWIILLAGVVQFSRLFKTFLEYHREMEASMLGLAGELKKIESSLTELIVEQRRISRLTIEQLDLKKAELTGDFDIVEEPIYTPPEPPKAPETPS